MVKPKKTRGSKASDATVTEPIPATNAPEQAKDNAMEVDPAGEVGETARDGGKEADTAATGEPKIDKPVPTTGHIDRSTLAAALDVGTVISSLTDRIKQLELELGQAKAEIDESTESRRQEVAKWESAVEKAQTIAKDKETKLGVMEDEFNKARDRASNNAFLLKQDKEKADKEVGRLRAELAAMFDKEKLLAQREVQIQRRQEDVERTKNLLIELAAKVEQRV
jgi:hypothetical protein